MSAYKINTFITANENRNNMTKFGGQPDWITTPQWPVSLAWDNRPLKFIGQIRLNDFYSELKDLTLAYIFITQPEDINSCLYIYIFNFPHFSRLSK